MPKARSSFEQALKAAQDNDQRHYEGHSRICLGRLIIEEDASQIGAAEQAILEGMKMEEDLHFRSYEAWGHLGLGETYSIAGQAEKALDSLSKAREMGREMGMDYYLARTEKALEKLKAQ